MENTQNAENARESFHLDGEDAAMLCFGDDENFQTISDDITSKHRWYVVHEIVVKNKQTGKFFRGHYLQGGTEMQGGFDDNNASGVDFAEVFPQQKTITIYV